MFYVEKKDKRTHKPDEFAQRLLKWFSENRRDFPWRETSDPYKVLIAEIFLRKTDARKVLTIYEHFMQKYPGFEALINADGRELEEFLRPLGLYRRRAKELIDLAQIVTFPICESRSFSSIDKHSQKLNVSHNITQHLQNGR